MKHHITRLTPVILLAILLVSARNAASQTSGPISLQQAIEYGLANNSSYKKTELDIQRNEYRYSEVRSGYLPQITGSVQFMDNLQLQTSILPGELAGGEPGSTIPVQFGTKFNVNAVIDANQAIYDQSQIYNMRLARQNGAISELSLAKSKEQLTYDIANTYYAAQISLTQKKLVTDNLVKLDSLVKITTIQFNNGFATKLDVDKLRVSQTNQQTQQATAESNYQQQLLMLKYLMGLPLDAPVEVVAIDMSANPTSGIVNPESLNMTEINLATAQKEIYETNLSQVKAGYLPSLTANFRFMYMFQQNDLRVFDKNANWFPSSYVGLTLNVPIFDGLTKYNKAKQVKLQIDQTDLDIKYLTESLKMQRSNAQTKLSTNLASLESQQRNIELAQEVFQTTEVQYKGGIANMTDLVNSETSLKEAQANYLQALVQVKIAELDLLRATGNINTIK